MCSFNLVRQSLRSSSIVISTNSIYRCVLMFSVLAYSSPANSYLRLHYLRFPPVRTRTCVLSTCIFHPFIMYCFVLIFSEVAFSNTCTCDFSASFILPVERFQCLSVSSSSSSSSTYVEWMKRANVFNSWKDYCAQPAGALRSN